VPTPNKPSKANQELLANLSRDIQYYAAHTRQQYINHAIDYLSWVGPKRDWRDKEGVYLYIAKLGKDGHAQAHINYLIRGPVGSLFRMEGLRLPVKLPRVMPAVYTANEAMFFKVAQIRDIIRAAKNGTLQEQWLIAVATTYVPRAREIQRIKEEDILRDKNVIVIHTVKHNLKRQHLIPDQISEILLNYDYPELSVDFWRDVLYSIIARAGIQRKLKQSFHSIRHTLLDELAYGGMADEEVASFVGWLKGGTLGAYARPLLLRPENDKKAFAVIPWLDTWLE